MTRPQLPPALHGMRRHPNGRPAVPAPPARTTPNQTRVQLHNRCSYHPCPAAPLREPTHAPVTPNTQERAQHCMPDVTGIADAAAHGAMHASMHDAELAGKRRPGFARHMPPPPHPFPHCLTLRSAATTVSRLRPTARCAVLCPASRRCRYLNTTPALSAAASAV